MDRETKEGGGGGGGGGEEGVLPTGSEHEAGMSQHEGTQTQGRSLEESRILGGREGTVLPEQLLQLAVHEF